MNSFSKNASLNRDIILFTSRLRQWHSMTSQHDRELYSLLIEENIFSNEFELALIAIRDSSVPSLANRLDDHPQIFSKYYITIIRNGERHGNMVGTLDSLIEMITFEASLADKW